MHDLFISVLRSISLAKRCKKSNRHQTGIWLLTSGINITLNGAKDVFYVISKVKM